MKPVSETVKGDVVQSEIPPAPRGREIDLPSAAAAGNDAAVAPSCSDGSLTDGGLRVETRLAVLGRGSHHPGEPLNVPIVPVSNFHAASSGWEDASTPAATARRAGRPSRNCSVTSRAARAPWCAGVPTTGRG